MANTSKALEISGLFKKYGDFEAISDLKLSVKEGECVGLLGTNGAGKTTTIKTITGQLKPSLGEVKVFGVNPSIDPKSVHSFIGYIPDDQTIYEEITVFENIDLFRRLHRLPKEKTFEIIEELSLGEKKDIQSKKLSRGLRQRVLIARALMHNPRLILLDEPTSGLDPSSAESIHEVLLHLKKKGSSILLTTHLMNDVDKLCDHIIFLHHGRKVKEGSPQQLKDEFREPYVVVEYIEEGLRKREKLKKEEDYLTKLQALEERGTIISIHTHEPRLEDIFSSVIGGQS